MVDAGIEVDRGSSANVYMLWNETEDRWTFTNDGVGYEGVGFASTAPYANAAFIVANAAYTSQNASGNVANAAFIRANNSLNANVGGQVTGDVIFVGNVTSNTLTTTGSNGSISGANAIFTNYIFAANGNVDLYIYTSRAYNQANAAYSNSNTYITYAEAVSVTQNNSITAAFIRANNSLDANNGGIVVGDVIFAGNLSANIVGGTF